MRQNKRQYNRSCSLAAKLIMLVALALVAGCADDTPDTPDTSDSVADSPSDNRASMPNPAAVFCVEQGGSYLLETSECQLADGSVQDGWDYYRQHPDRW